MNIYIAHTHDNRPLAVILAESNDFAEVAFRAMKLNHHSVEEINLTGKNFHNNKVLYLLTSEEREVDDKALRKHLCRVWKRGL